MPLLNFWIKAHTNHSKVAYFVIFINRQGAEMQKYTNHSKELPRINKIIGQLDGIKKMIETEKNCVEILFQLKAVRSAIKSLEGEILESHLKHCVLESFDSEENRNIKIEELISLFKRFDV